MALKGTLAAFTFSTLELATVDERRLLRKELNDKGVTLEKLDVSMVGGLIFPYFLNDIELMLCDHGKDLLGQFTTLINALLPLARQKPSVYELVNLQRLILTITEINPAIQTNKEAFVTLLSKQENLPIRMQVLFQEIREANTKTTKMKVGKDVFQLLCEVAGAKEGINAAVKINESHVNHNKELAQRFGEGYIYHWSLEEEIKHISFDQIFKKVPEAEKDYFFQLVKLLDELAKTTNAVYTLNWKHITLLRRVYSLFFELAFRE